MVPVTLLLLLLGVPYLLSPVAQVLFAIFAGILVAIFLDGCASLLRRIAPIRRGFALAIVIVVVFFGFSGLLWLAGAQMADQAMRLVERLPAALDAARSHIMGTGWMKEIYSRLSQGGGGVGKILGNITAVFSSTFGALGNVVIIAFTGIYIAVNPDLYSNALLRLVPSDKRPRGREILRLMGEVMRYWIVGRLASMAVVGILTSIGLLLVGQPLALILGVIAGLLSFIPFLGPLLAAIPAVLIGLPIVRRWPGGSLLFLPSYSSSRATSSPS